MDVGARAARIPAVIIALAASGFALVAAAQNPPESRYNSQLITAGRDERQQLQSTIAAIKEQRYSEATAAIGKLLQGDSQEDYFLDANGRSSLKSEARKLLLGLPKAGQDSYELQFGADAKALLTTALNSDDDAALLEVISKFAQTRAAYEASIAWARRELDAGRPRVAAVTLEQVLTKSPYAAQYDPQLWMLTAIGWRMAGDEPRAQQALLQLKRRAPKTITIAGREQPMFERDDAALAWLTDITGSLPKVATPLATEWTMHRGGTDRNALADCSLPVGIVRWRRSLGHDQLDDELLARRAKAFQLEQIAAIPTLSPLVVRNTVLARTPQQLQAIDLDTGKLLWQYASLAPIDPTENTPFSRRLPSAAQQRERQLMQRVWEDRAYGQMTADGDAVYLLDRMGYAGLGYSPENIVGFGGILRPNDDQPRIHNTLVSLDLAQPLDPTLPKAPRWMVGGESGEAEPKLAGAFFLGVPLAHQQCLYAMVEAAGEIRLVVLAASTGKLLWSQQLALIENPSQQILSDTTRRLAGATPSLADGILVCPTSASTVVAVDLIQRQLLWTYQYVPSTAIRQQGSWIGAGQPPLAVGSHWGDATATISEGKVILTPPDSDSLHCLDLWTGKPVFKPLKRTDSGNELLYVATVQDGKIVLVGRQKVLALLLSDGKHAWPRTLSLETNQIPSGRGLATSRHYLLPTMTQLLRINLSTGEIDARSTNAVPLGNIIAHQGQLISQSYDGITASYQSEALRSSGVSEKTPDATGLMQQAQLQLFDGKPANALRMLRQALQLSPTNDDIRALLARTLLDEMQRDFTSAQTHATEIEPLLDQPDQRREYLRLKAWGWEKQKNPVAAFEAYLQLARQEIAGASPVDHPRSFDPADPLWRVRFDCWVPARLNDLYQAASTEQQKQFASLLDTIVTANLAKESPTPQVERLVQYMGWHSAADPARVRLATLRMKSSDLLGAEVAILPLAEQQSGNHAGQAAAILAEIYTQAGRADYAARQYARLRAHWPQTPVRGEQTGEQIAIAALASSPVKTNWPPGAVNVTQGPEVVANGNDGFSANQRVYALPIAEARGALADGSSLVFDARRQLTLRDSLGRNWSDVSLVQFDGRQRSSVQAPMMHAHLAGHLALVSVGTDVLAYNMLQKQADPYESLLWSQDLLPSSSDGAIGTRNIRLQAVTFGWANKRDVATIRADAVIGAMASVSELAACYTRLRDVVCVDPLTGATRWERTMRDSGYELFGDDEYLFAVPPRGEEATVLSVRDGAVLGQRKVEVMDYRWATYGRNVLSVRQDGREFVARLWDGWSQKVLWDQRFTFGARGTLIGRDEMAMLQPDGKLTLVSLVDGSVRLSTQLEAEPKLVNLHVLRSSTQYFVQVETLIDVKEALPQIAVQPVPTTGDSTRAVTGPLYAFDRATGQPSWPSPAYISQHGFVLDQPTDLPVLCFLRQLTPTTSSAGREPRTSVMVIDRRDGRLILERDDIRIQSTNIYDLEGDPATARVTLKMAASRGAPSKKFTFTLTGEPMPPSPPVQTGVRSSLPPPSSDNTTKPPILPVGEVPGRNPREPSFDPADPFGPGRDPFLPRPGIPPFPPGGPPPPLPRPPQ